MQMIYLSNFISILFAFLWASLSAQPIINVNIGMDTSTVGKEIEVILELPAEMSINSLKLVLIEKEVFDNISDSIINTGDLEMGDFEISDFGDLSGENNTIFFQNINITDENKINISLRIWDHGTFYILSFPDNENEFYRADISAEHFPSIHILPSIDPDDPDETLAPIKDIIKQKKEFYDYIAWYHFLILIIPIIILLLWLHKKLKTKKEIAIENEIRQPVIPYLDALKKLNELKSEKIWMKGMVKEFHQQLTFILREYLYRKYGFNALEQSTTEIRNTISIYINDKKHIDTISDILQISDLVKFAKAKVEEDLNEKFLDNTIELINTLK